MYIATIIMCTSGVVTLLLEHRSLSSVLAQNRPLYYYLKFTVATCIVVLSGGRRIHIPASDRRAASEMSAATRLTFKDPLETRISDWAL